MGTLGMLVLYMLVLLLLVFMALFLGGGDFADGVVTGGKIGVGWACSMFAVLRGLRGAVTADFAVCMP